MKIVWKFTNKLELTEHQFVDYFGRKVKSTIRKYNMPIGLVKNKGIKAEIINGIIKNLPKRAGIVKDDNLDEISVSILYEAMHRGDLDKFLPRNQPLYFLSDKEIMLYAKIKKIKGKIPGNKDKKIENFIKEIEKKNPDIRHNIVNAVLKLEK